MAATSTSKPQKRWTTARKKFLKEKSKLKDWSDKVKKIYRELDDPLVENDNKKFKKGKSAVNRYHNEIKKFQEKQTEKEARQEEYERKKKEREEAMGRHDTEQKRKRKLLYKKNHKGQPNMGTRMQLLLEKIEKQKNQPT